MKKMCKKIFILLVVAITSLILALPAYAATSYTEVTKIPETSRSWIEQTTVYTLKSSTHGLVSFKEYLLDAWITKDGVHDNNSLQCSFSTYSDTTISGSGTISWKILQGTFGIAKSWGSNKQQTYTFNLNWKDHPDTTYANAALYKVCSLHNFEVKKTKVRYTVTGGRTNLGTTTSSVSVAEPYSYSIKPVYTSRIMPR